jgi:ribosome-associated protein YbcJ (S4-like RNA binding protein)
LINLAVNYQVNVADEWELERTEKLKEDSEVQIDEHWIQAGTSKV